MSAPKSWLQQNYERDLEPKPCPYCDHGVIRKLTWVRGPGVGLVADRAVEEPCEHCGGTGVEG